jgi:hypothetical protein
MKAKLLTLVLIATLSLQLTSCKKEVKKADAIEYIIEPKTTTINWTAYKTTEKKPVKGIFKTVNVVKTKVSTNPFEAINGIEFSIPVNSIDTKKPNRDTKIIKSFFGSMKSTQSITGRINLGENGKGDVDLSMNGITTKLPITYVISGQLVEINATLNLDNWKAQLAIATLNKACNEKHKGADGISKTWNEVNINIVSYLKVK